MVFWGIITVAQSEVTELVKGCEYIDGINGTRKSLTEESIAFMVGTSLRNFMCDYASRNRVGVLLSQPILHGNSFTGDPSSPSGRHVVEISPLQSPSPEHGHQSEHPGCTNMPPAPRSRREPPWPSEAWCRCPSCAHTPLQRFISISPVLGKPHRSSRLTAKVRSNVSIEHFEAERLHEELVGARRGGLLAVLLRVLPGDWRWDASVSERRRSEHNTSAAGTKGTTYR